MAFMEDYGISKTFATEDDNQKLAVDAFFIENNFDDPFTIKYLNTYYDYQINTCRKLVLLVKKCDSVDSYIKVRS